MKCFFSLLFVGLLLPLAGEELSRNGSFEQRFKGWDYPHWERRPEPGQITSERVYGGKYAYDMGRKGDAENYIYTALPVEPGKSYLLRICLRADDMPEKDAELRLLRFRPEPGGEKKFRTDSYVERSPGGGETALIVTGGTHPWKEYELYLDESRFPEGTSHVNLIISRKRNGNGILGIDELSFEEVPRREAPKKERSAALNLWPGDSSFESASWPFRLPRDGKAHYHGEYSLRVDPAVKEFGFHYLFGVMEPDKKYVLSFYARAAEPCSLKVGVGNEFYRTVGSASFQLAREWKLCAVPLAVHPGRSLSAQFSRETEAEVRLDAFSLTASDTAPAVFQPVPELVLGVPESEEPMEVYYTGTKPVNRTVTLRNNGSEKREIELSAGLETPFAPTRKLLDKRRIVLAPGERHEETLAVLPERRQGYYVIRIAAENKAERIVSSIPFVVTAPPPPIGENSMFGLHNGEYDAFRRIGMAWVRHYRNWSFWPMRDGKYDTSCDGPSFFNLKQPFRDYGIRHMETLFIADAPTRLKQAGKPHASYEEMERFVDAMIEGTRGISRYYEIENEPHLAFPTVFKTGLLDAAKIYAEMTKKLSRRIKELNPDAQILGAGVGLREDSNFEFIRTVLEIAGKDIDILAIHPYADARYINAEYSDIGPEDIRMYSRTLALREMIRKMGFHQDIWYGEVGWALDVNEDYLSSSAMRHAAYLSRLMLLAKAADVKKVFYFLGDHHIEKEKFYYGLWRVRRPLPAALAYAASAQILEGSEPDGMISDSDLHIFTYRDRTGKLFAALWLSGNRQAKAVIDLPSDAVEVCNLFGQPVERKKGRLELEASGAPLYLFAGNVPEATFREALKKTGIDLPPVKIGWRLSSAEHISVTLKNQRSETLAGRFTLEGVGKTEARDFSLAPGNAESFAFELGSASGSRTLKLAGTSNLGGFASEYRLELLPCPRLTPRSEADTPLPEKGRLEALTDRTHLLPNDPNNGWNGPANLSVESVLGYDDDNLYLLADVRDDVHVQKQEPGNLWRDDALQLAIDTRTDALPGTHGYDPDDYEFGFALGADGARKELTHVYELGRAARILDEVSCTAFRRGDVTGYRIAIPWKTLKMKPEKGKVFGLNFIVNDNDGPGSRFYMGLTPGIVEVKNPYAFRKFTLE